MEERPQIEHLTNLLEAVEAGTTVPNVIGSFKRAGFRNTAVVAGMPVVTFHRGWVKTIAWSDDDGVVPRAEPLTSRRRMRIEV